MEHKDVITKTVKMTSVTNRNDTPTSQFIVRIPKEIEDFLEIKKGDKFEFIIEVAEPREESKLSFRIVR